MTGAVSNPKVNSKKTKVIASKPGDEKPVTKSEVAEVKAKVEDMKIYSKEESDDDEMMNALNEDSELEKALKDETPAPAPTQTKKVKAIESSDEEDEVLVPETQPEKSEEKKKPTKKEPVVPSNQSKLDSVVVKQAPPTGSKIKKVRKVKKVITETDEDGFVVNKTVMVDEEYEVDAEPEPEKSILTKKTNGAKKQGGLGAFFGKA